LSVSRVSRSDKYFDWINTFFFVIVLIVVLYPLYFILIASISSPDQVNAGKVLFFPVDISFDGYMKLLETTKIWLGYRNSIVYAILGTAIGTTAIVMGAYSLSRKDLVGRTLFMILITLTMFFNGGLIPTYLQVKQLGFLDTIWAVILPSAITAFQVIITKTFFEMTIPDELLEAAQMDGCNNTYFFMRIVLPLSLPIVAVIVLFSFVSQWNAYFNALIYLRNNDLYPLQLVLREILIQNQATDLTGGDVNDLLERQRLAELIKYGAIIAASLPLLVMYPFVQRFFVKGIMIGSVKG
jgi:putative aldouronate transport system permease protein